MATMTAQGQPAQFNAGVGLSAGAGSQAGAVGLGLVFGLMVLAYFGMRGRQGSL